MLKLIAVVVLVVFSLFPSEDAFKIKPRIVNGHNAPQQKYPFYVFLEVKENWEEFVCGGTLLNNEFVLTAGHCVDGATSIKAHLGEVDFFKPHLKFQLNEQHYIKHPHFRHGAYPVNDIALIRLPNKVEFTPHMQPVRLPTTCESENNIDVVIMGNGYTSDAGPLTPKLRHAFLKTIPSEVCRREYRLTLPLESIICAMDHVGTGRWAASTCTGDSGAPLVKSDGTLLGAASFGSYNCDNGDPQVFTRLLAHSKWINEMTGLDLPEC